MKNKEAFCKEFGELLKRYNVENVDNIKWDDVQEIATVYFRSPWDFSMSAIQVNCAYDSCLGILHDICKHALR